MSDNAKFVLGAAGALVMIAGVGLGGTGGVFVALLGAVIVAVLLFGGGG